MILIGVSGKRRTGKTTFADILVKTWGFKQYSLAAPLKEDVRRIFNLTKLHTDGRLKETFNKGLKMSPRQKMIEYGALKREEDPNYWIKRVAEEILKAPQAQMQKAVISDIRFKNEADWIKKHDGYLVRLNRDQKYTGKNLNDPSETDLDEYPDFDLEVAAYLNRTPTDLAITADLLMGLIELSKMGDGQAA